MSFNSVESLSFFSERGSIQNEFQDSDELWQFLFAVENAQPILV